MKTATKGKATDRILTMNPVPLIIPVANYVNPKADPIVAQMAKGLQDLQRRRAVVLKSRVMIANRLQAVIAGTLGYSAFNDPEERTKKFLEATKVIKAVVKGEQTHPMQDVIMAHHLAITDLERTKDVLEKEMVACSEKLPIAQWVSRSEQRGFGLLFLAIVIGETGDLANYANPAKVWRRLGCAPFKSVVTTSTGELREQVAMGATWRSGREGKLSAEQWAEFGYSPRRRSIAYLIGKNLWMQNQSGPYRKRAEEAKATFAATHPEYKPMRCQLHCMLLATKLLLKNLWIEWNK